MKRTLLLLLAALALSMCGAVQTQAQSIWASAEVDVKIYKGFSGFAEAEYRTFDQVTGTARWSGTFGLEYKPVKYVKTSIGYSYLHDHEDEHLTNKGNILESYWQPRHRFNASVTGSYSWDFGLKISLRERYQYTYNQGGMSVGKTDAAGNPKPDEIIQAKDKHILRSRLQIAYEIPKIKLEPYISCEVYNDLLGGFAVDKLRYTAGLEYPITKMHGIKLYYMFQDFSRPDKLDDHIIGIGYKLKIRPKKKK